MCHRADNRNEEIIMSVGSPVPELYREAVLVYKLCRETFGYLWSWSVQIIIVLLMSF